MWERTTRLHRGPCYGGFSVGTQFEIGALVSRIDNGRDFTFPSSISRRTFWPKKQFNPFRSNSVLSHFNATFQINGEIIFSRTFLLSLRGLWSIERIKWNGTITTMRQRSCVRMYELSRILRRKSAQEPTMQSKGFMVKWQVWHNKFYTLLTLVMLTENHSFFTAL